jgi:hypothetical protein
MHPTQCSIPIRRVNDRLGNIPGHGGKVDLHLGQCFDITADTSNTLTVRLGSRDIERCAGGVEAGYLKAAIGQQKGESACSATDIQYPMSTELLRDSDVYIEVAPVGVERVIDRDSRGCSNMGSAMPPTMAESSKSFYDGLPNSTPPGGSTRRR